MVGKPRVTLRAITYHDQDVFIGLVRASADLHHPWMSLPSTPATFDTWSNFGLAPNAQDSAANDAGQTP